MRWNSVSVSSPGSRRDWSITTCCRRHHDTSKNDVSDFWGPTFTWVDWEPFEYSTRVWDIGCCSPAERQPLTMSQLWIPSTCSHYAAGVSLKLVWDPLLSLPGFLNPVMLPWGKRGWRQPCIPPWLVCKTLTLSPLCFHYGASIFLWALHFWHCSSLHFQTADTPPPRTNIVKTLWIFMQAGEK